MRERFKQLRLAKQRAFLGQLIFRNIHRGHDVDVRAHSPAEKPSIVLAGAHGKRQASDLRRARVNFQTREVVLQNKPGNLAFAIAALFIHGKQQVERIHQNMTRTARRVAQRYVLWPINMDEILMLGIGLYVVFHLLAQATLRVVQHPQATQAVLHHVAHNPFGREQLRCHGQRVGSRLRLRFEELVFRLGVVVLVHPPEDFHVGQPIFFGNALHHGLHHATVFRKLFGQQQPHGRIHRLKHIGNARRKLLALRQKQIAEQLIIVACLLQLQHATRIEALDRQIERLAHGLRSKAAIGVAEHAHAAWQIIAQLHEANGNHTVEPCIGHPFAQAIMAKSRIAFTQASLQLQQCRALLALNGRKRQVAHNVCIRGRRVFGHNAVFLHAQLNALLKHLASLTAKRFDR